MIQAFEGVRGLAALLVALFHLDNLTGFILFRHLYLCVDLFFVLSGWVIASNYLARLGTWADFRRFVERRAWRLLPLLFFSTGAWILVANAVYAAKRLVLALGVPLHLDGVEKLAAVVPKATELLGVLTLTHGLGFFRRLILNGPTWSISSEFYTYLIFGLACVGLGRLGRWLAFTGLFLAGALVTVLGALYAHQGPIASHYMDLSYDFGLTRCIWSFFLGALVYQLRERVTWPKAHLQAGSLALVAAALLTIERLPAIAFAFPFLFALLVLSVSTDEGFLAVLLTSRLAQRLGERSYSIYLMHVPLTLLFWPLTSRIKARNATGLALVEDLVFLVVLFYVSGLTYRHIEVPFRRGRSRAPAQVPAV